MMRLRNVSRVALAVVIVGAASAALGMKEQVRPLGPPANAIGERPFAAPFVMLQTGDTTWVQVHSNNTRCPGDPLVGHGGEALGGPTGSETWCVERGVGDTCGTVSPWTTNCFKYVDVRSLSSQVGVNYWHVDSYRTNQRTYTGNRALWCGSNSTWQGKPVECGTWQNAPGYGSYWNCAVQLALPATFGVAGGCTLYFDPRYDTECKYDYFYVDYWDGSAWTTLGLFNATSNNPGANCGAPSKPAPDYYGNIDANRLVNCNWQSRDIPAQPAFKGIITPAMLGGVTSAPKFRWRFASDGGFSDADGTGDTDGAAFIDNVWVYGDRGDRYTQDFEGSSVFGPLPQYWTLENPTGVCQGWHIYHDPDAPYEGGDGGTRTTCTLDSSWLWRGRLDNGYPPGTPQRYGWFYRMMSPKVRIPKTGAVVQYDQFMCAQDITCDYTNTKVRFYDRDNQTWCPWNDIDGYILTGGCFFWNFDQVEDVTSFYGASADSMQFCWELMDVSSPGDVCRGKHKDTENLIDNVSIGFYDGNASQFSARGIDILHDSFLPSVAQGFNSFFGYYSTDSVSRYSGPAAPPLQKAEQLNLNVTDKDGLALVQIVGSTNGGKTWVSRSMTLDIPSDPLHPLLGGQYYGTLRASDFTPGATQWAVGTECWYYVKATDVLSNVEYFPVRANPSHPQHAGGVREDYWGFSILPQFPPSYNGVKILLVDGMNQLIYDYGQCLSSMTTTILPEDVYENTLRDAGYCYDKFDISGAGSNQHIHPLQFSDYDAVVWLTGPYFSNYLFDKEAQEAIRAYLAEGGKVVLCGDRIAMDMAPLSEQGNGEDSLGGEFLAGILGADYLREMESPFDPSGRPFIYTEAVPTVNVFGSPVSIPLDTLLVYRECPYLKDMDYVLTNTSPPAGYTAQRLLRVTNPGLVPQADGAIYTEYQGVGQCVYVGFDLSAVGSHRAGYCSGATPTPAPDFRPGYYYGRVELMRVILNNLFGLPPAGGGGGTSGVEPKATYQWALSQNTPNPLGSGTEIRYEVARAAHVSIKVYNAMGQMVQVLKNERTEPGRYSLTWDGRNRSGERVSSGVYFYKMEAEQYSAVKKMLVVK